MKKWAIAFLVMATWMAYAVEVVDNPAKPEQPLGLKLEKTQEFVLEDLEADVFVDQPGSFVVGTDGVHYVMDARSFRVFRFDAYGKYLGSFAGKGQGPGQIGMMARDVVLTHNGGIAIPEMVRRVVHVYDLEGRFKSDGTFAMKTAFGMMPARGNGYVARAADHSSDRRQEWQQIVYLNNEFGDPVTVYQGEKVDAIMAMMDPYLIPFCVDPDGNVLVAPGLRTDYVIRRYSPKGVLLQEIRRAHDPVKRLPEDIDLMKKTGKDMMALFRSGETGKVLEPSPYEHAVSELVVDKKGRIWALALQGRNAEGRRVYGFDVFSPEGKLVDRLEMRGMMFRFYEDQLVVLTRNEEGDAVIQHWRIMEPQGGAE